MPATAPKDASNVVPTPLPISSSQSIYDQTPSDGVRLLDLVQLCSQNEAVLGSAKLHSLHCSSRPSSSGLVRRSIIVCLPHSQREFAWLRLERRLDARPLEGDPQWLVQAPRELAVVSRKKEHLVFASEKLTEWDHRMVPTLADLLGRISFILNECRKDEILTSDLWLHYVNRWLFHSFVQQTLDDDRRQAGSNKSPGLPCFCHNLRTRILERPQGRTGSSAQLSKPSDPGTKSRRPSSSVPGPREPSVSKPPSSVQRVLGDYQSGTFDLSLACELILGILSIPQWKEETLRQTGSDATLVCDFIQRFLDKSRGQASLQGIGEKALRLLQDISSRSGELPTSCWIHGVVVNPLSFISRGGEAIIQHGDYNGLAVAVRNVLPPHGTTWESEGGRHTLRLIKREIITHRQLDHPNVIKLLGVFRDKKLLDVPVIILPFFKNGPSKRWLIENPSPVNFVRVLNGAVSGLLYFHTRRPPVIHGDLHSGNILVDDEGNAVLCDFGFSHIRHEISRSLSSPHTTQNYRFLAPELANLMMIASPTDGPNAGLRPNQATDVYALAMTFYELGTLQQPFSNVGSPFKALELAMLGQRPAQPERLGGLSAKQSTWVWEYMEKMWSQRADRRIEMKDLYSFIAQLSLEISSSR